MGEQVPGRFSWSVRNYHKVLSNSMTYQFYLPLKDYTGFSKGLSKSNKEMDLVALSW